MAGECASRNVTIPIDLLWCHYVKNKDKEASAQIWSKYLQARSVRFRPIVKFAFKEGDPSLVVALIDFLKTEEHHRGCIGGVYSSLLHIHMRNGDIDEAIRVLDGIEVEEGSLDIIKHDDLRLLKKKVEATGKMFPYEIPKKEMKKKN